MIRGFREGSSVFTGVNAKSTFFLTEGGVYSAGKYASMKNTKMGSQIYTKITIPKENVDLVHVDLCEHFAVLTKSNKVRCFGRNRHSQLGHVERSVDSTELSFFDDKHVVAVRCMYRGTFVVTQENRLQNVDESVKEVYGFGYNNFGDLGIGSCTRPEVIPKKAILPKTEILVGLETGQDHTAFIFKSGVVYMTGYNYTGCLGIGHLSCVSTPVPIDYFQKKGIRIIDASLGYENFSVFLSDKGQVYTCGSHDCLGYKKAVHQIKKNDHIKEYNENGGEKNCISLPLLYPFGELKNEFVVKIFAFSNGASFLSKNGGVFIVGHMNATAENIASNKEYYSIWKYNINVPGMIVNYMRGGMGGLWEIVVTNDRSVYVKGMEIVTQISGSTQRYKENSKFMKLDLPYRLKVRKSNTHRKFKEKVLANKQYIDVKILTQ